MMDLNDFINKNLRVFQLALDEDGNGPLLHKPHHLQAGIAKWQQIFRSLDLDRPNPTIGLLHHLNFEYICMLYAAMSMGVNFVVLDARFDDQSTHKVFLPLDILVYDDNMDIMCDDPEYWKQNARNHIDARQVPKTRIGEADTGVRADVALDFDPAQAQILSSTTSGSTGQAKIVTHSYQYILDIAQRNADVLGFQGRAAHIKNLYHGSSMPVFYLPSLIRSDFHYCVPWAGTSSLAEVKRYVKNDLGWSEHLDINHILFPHTYMIDKFLETVVDQNMIFSDLTVYTLSYIKPEYHRAIRGRNIRIVSIFGCTETSGPVLINTLSNDNIDEFDPMIFYSLDDFFEITLLPDGTRVRSKNGLVDHVMSDKFELISDGCYRHLGRSDLYRINDVVIDLARLADIRARFSTDLDIIIDTVEQKLYLALWEEQDPKEITDQVNQELDQTFGSELLYISETSNLNKLDYISGIKLSQELVREHFRNLGDQ